MVPSVGRESIWPVTARSLGLILALPPALHSPCFMGRRSLENQPWQNSAQAPYDVWDCLR